MNSPTNEDHGDAWSHRVDVGRATESSGRATKRRRTDANGGPTRERGIMRDGNGSGLPRFVGSASGIHLIRTVYDVLARSNINRDRNRLDAAADVVPGEEDQLIGPSRSDHPPPGVVPVTPFWHPDEIMDNVATVDFNDLVQWTEGYFRYWHPMFPVLHGPTFLGILEQVSQYGMKALAPADTIVVQSILSISLADFRQVGYRHQPFPQKLVFLNQEDIGASLVRILSSPASIKNIQAALCVELFLISMLKFNMASRIGGTIVRMAFNLGLHRCPGRYPNFGVHDALMRKRLWWSIYCLDRIVCQMLGLPLGIRDDDVDVCLLSEEFHHIRPDSQGNDSILQEQRYEYEQLQLLVILSKHAKLRGMILELRNKSINFRHEDPERTLRIQAELKKWTNEVYDLTSTYSVSRGSSSGGEHGSDSDISDDSMSPPHRVLLSILQHELVLSLHRPLLVSDLGTASSQAAFQECINASKAIIDIAASNTGNCGHQGLDLKYGHLLWPSLTWSVWMSCFVLTYAAIEGVSTAVSAKRYANRALRVLKLLSLRNTLWPERCTLAVEQLITFLGEREGMEERSRSAARPSQRPPRSVKSRHYAEALRTLVCQHNNRETNQVANSNNPRENCLHGCDDSNSVNHLSQGLHTSTSDDPTNTTTAQEFPMPGFPGYASNPAFEYVNRQGVGGVDHIYADPLIALDFANFAQGSMADSILDFSLDSSGFA